MLDSSSLSQLAHDIKQWGYNLGFHQVGITNIELGEHHQHLQNWLAKNYHGTMDYMAKHGEKRSHPEQLVPGTIRVISVAMNYLTDESDHPPTSPPSPKAAISRYALGRDYHKVVRSRLKKLSTQIVNAIGQDPIHKQYRVFVDSAPVLEKALGQKANLGFIGKHTLLIAKQAGSWFFLGEIYTDLPLPIDSEHQEQHCGRCQRCLDICPTQAIVAPFQLDARRCIAYLTIEYKGVIPLEFRPLIGNRVFGCDDCQLVCPWNKFAQCSTEIDFSVRHDLNDVTLLELFAWDEWHYLKLTEGSPIRRIGYMGFMRNIAVALGNAPYDSNILTALYDKRPQVNDLVQEHIDWAIAQQLHHQNKKTTSE